MMLRDIDRYFATAYQRAWQRADQETLTDLFRRYDPEYVLTLFRERSITWPAERVQPAGA